MRPNAVHGAITLASSICHGESFYSSSTMLDTYRGIVHSFVDHIKITNTNHPPVASLLRYIARFYHSGLVELGLDAFTGEYCPLLADRNHLNSIQPRRLATFRVLRQWTELWIYFHSAS